jgi:hypothetical protein
LALARDLPYRGRMMKIGLVASLALAVLSTLACQATVGVKNVSLPRDAAQQCATHCQTIGMRLSAVAIMAENVGCVCQFAAQPAAGPNAAGQLETPAAGMATIAVQEAAAAAALAQQQRQQQQQQQH